MIPADIARHLDDGPCVVAIVEGLECSHWVHESLPEPCGLDCDFGNPSPPTEFQGQPIGKCPHCQPVVNRRYPRRHPDHCPDCHDGDLTVELRVETHRPRAYVASKSKHAPMWRALRDSGQLNIISTWIDMDGDGVIDDWPSFWADCTDQAVAADAVVAYYEPGETWKGALVEIGCQLANAGTVIVVGSPGGSWTQHPDVRLVDSMDEAIHACNGHRTFTAVVRWVPVTHVHDPITNDGPELSVDSRAGSVWRIAWSEKDGPINPTLVAALEAVHGPADTWVGKYAAVAEVVR